MKASEIIRERGWCQHVSKNKDGAVCMTQAIYESVMGSIPAYAAASFDWKIIDAKRELVERRLGIRVGEIPQWNDSPTRTKEEVIAALEAVGE